MSLAPDESGSARTDESHNDGQMQLFDQRNGPLLLATVEMPQRTVEAPVPTRTLKIEEDGDHWKGTIKPKIRLKGSWLERAGFKPGSQVDVRCIAHGIIELRSQNTVLTMSEATHRTCELDRD